MASGQPLKVGFWRRLVDRAHGGAASRPAARRRKGTKSRSVTPRQSTPDPLGPIIDFGKFGSALRGVLTNGNLLDKIHAVWRWIAAAGASIGSAALRLHRRGAARSRHSRSKSQRGSGRTGTLDRLSILFRVGVLTMVLTGCSHRLQCLSHAVPLERREYGAEGSSARHRSQSRELGECGLRQVPILAQPLSRRRVEPRPKSESPGGA